ncbi:MAG: Na/Pi cotransporter family protein [Spirochaetaceae bacterium]|nr:Na/Pi cotransporter family protein [Spirochaetaceae bacterium]
MEMFYALLGILIGAGVFLFGLALFSQTVKNNATKKTRAMFDKIGGNRFSAFGLGVVATAIIQSSTATVVMSVGLVSAGMLTLFQAMAIVLGAHLGTTSTLFLVGLSTFNVRYLFMGLIFAGALIRLIKKDGKILILADFFIGFGLVFVGLMLMGNVFRDNMAIREYFIDLFIRINFPLLLLLLGAAFTMIIQSSTATASILLLLIVQGVLPFESAMFLFLGAHVGTSSTAVLASLAANTDGKRLALMNVFFSFFGVFVFTSFMWPLKDYVVPQYVAHIAPVWTLPIFQLFYNLVMGLIKIWFITPMQKWVCSMLKDKEENKTAEEKIFGVTYLQEQLIDENVDIATDMAKKEILISADLVKSMFEKVDLAFKTKDVKLINEICETEVKVGILHRAIIPFLAKISEKESGSEETKRTINYLYIQNELESIGDIIDENLMALARKMINNNLAFSDQGSQELAELHGKVMDNFNRMVKAFVDEDVLVAKEIIDVYSDLEERKFQLLHINRLQQGIQKSADTSAVHLDVVNLYTRINQEIVFIAERILWLTKKEVA